MNEGQGSWEEGLGWRSPLVAATGMFPLREQIFCFVICKNYCEVIGYFERLVPLILFVFCFFVVVFSFLLCKIFLPIATTIVLLVCIVAITVEGGPRK